MVGVWRDGTGAVSDQRYPLSWPTGWKRTNGPDRVRADFGKSKAEAVTVRRYGQPDQTQVRDALAYIEPRCVEEREVIQGYVTRDMATGDPNCNGPRGCLIRAAKAEFTPADALVAQIETLTAERDEAREMVRLHHVECDDPDCATKLAAWPGETR